MKLYYIYESTAGCFGALSTGKRLANKFTNFLDAKRFMSRLPQNKNTIRFIDFDWM